MFRVFKKNRYSLCNFHLSCFLFFLLLFNLNTRIINEIGLPGKLASDHFDSQCLQVFSMDFPFLSDLEKKL